MQNESVAMSRRCMHAIEEPTQRDDRVGLLAIHIGTRRWFTVATLAGVDQRKDHNSIV